MDRISPLGGQAGTTVEVEVVGRNLSDFTRLRFDTPELEWIETISKSPEQARGRVRIAKHAALGPHRIQIESPTGLSNGRLFNVTEFPGRLELEPNDKWQQAQRITLRPQVVHGYMKGLSDVDHYSFQAKAGERWLFDVQSIERGGFLESSLHLLDASGKELAYNEDQDEFLETPRLSVRFPVSGEYILRVDQYRGPQGVSCGANCGYALHISQLPVVESVFPLGSAPGRTYSVTVYGEALETVSQAYLRRARGAEHYRLSFPYSIPVDGSDRDLAVVKASSVRSKQDSLEAVFQIPPEARTGLWRLWLVGSKGTCEALSIEIDRDPHTKDGVLGRENSYPVELHAGQPFHAWTLAAQLGLPSIDTVLELWSADGKLLAEHDDLMTGQGTVIGNPDSSLYYTPTKTEPATLKVKDRTDRKGTSFSYRLHMASEAAGFQLLTEPAEFSVRAGQEASLEVLLIKQPGFEKAVDVWVEGVIAGKGHFRADQHFGPSGDGDNINIPSIHLRIQAPLNLPPGDHKLQVFGKASDGSGRTVEAISTIWIGPEGKRNDTRRPLPHVNMYVLAP